MKISLQWLNKYVDLSDVPAEKIAETLPMIGLEVEEISSSGLVPLQNIVIGKIVSFKKHENSDHLSVCQVDVGDGKIRQIVCGAKNFKENDVVPVALPGAIMPGPEKFEIKEAKMRGEVSQGMMCSGRELGLSDDHAGLLILTERNLPLGTPINSHFPPADTVFEISITANRGDCLSHLGVARDLAAFFDKKLKNPVAGTPKNPPLGNGKNEFLEVKIESENCKIYNAWTIRGVKIAPSPEWLQRDLFAAGLRPINNVVDITNWVMLELGSPLHAFDAEKIGGNKIRIRQAAPAEKIQLLDGKTYELSPEMCVIADAENPLVIAGIMGGENSGVSGTTKNLVLEAAWFEPASTRKTSRKIAVSTDSSTRFTRNVDPTLVAAAGQRAAEMICEIAGGKIEGEQISLGAFPRGDREIEISGNFVRQKCGYDVPDEKILDVFRRLGFGVPEQKNLAGTWKILVPAFRPDVDRPIDLVEEFVRIFGTETIPSAPILAPNVPAEDALQTQFSRKAAALLCGQGFSECVHYTLRSGADLKKFFGEKIVPALALENPLTSDQSHIRPSLLPGLLDAVKLNLAAHNSPRRFFEIGKVFRSESSGTLREILDVSYVALAGTQSRTWKNREKIDFFFAKKLCLEIAAAAGIAEQRMLFAPSAGTPIWQDGHAAKAADRAKAAEIELGLIDAKIALDLDIEETLVAGEILFKQDAFAAAPKRARFKQFSAFPPVARDLALVVDEKIPAGEIAEKLKSTANKATAKRFAVEKINCFDVYRGKGVPEGKKSLAFEIVFRSETKTLTDEEVGAVFSKILVDIERAANCVVRR